MFYKSDTQKVDEIPISDITLTFVSIKYPQKFVEHLKIQWNYRFEQKYPGIYYVQKENDILPTQLIVTSRLNWEDNLWLRSLTNKLEDRTQIQKIVNEYHKNKRNKLYESVMDIIVKANHKEFEEAKGDMCKALEELMADVIEERVAEKVEERLAERVEERVKERTKEVTDNAMAQGELQYRGTFLLKQGVSPCITGKDAKGTFLLKRGASPCITGKRCKGDVSFETRSVPLYQKTISHVFSVEKISHLLRKHRMMHWGREKSQNPRPQRQKGQILLQRDVSFGTRSVPLYHKKRRSIVTEGRFF